MKHNRTTIAFGKPVRGFSAAPGAARTSILPWWRQSVGQSFRDRNLQHHGRGKSASQWQVAELQRAQGEHASCCCVSGKPLHSPKKIVSAIQSQTFRGFQSGTRDLCSRSSAPWSLRKREGKCCSTSCSATSSLSVIQKPRE
jgi:hypothetical protein